ncbi:stalk domain-containing protein [Hominilimicola sp.]|uniref:stalk domain-containing protein n=1 Tax=Hominilimicola sp. TaxID=3073571 RepID=UPI0039923955
MKSKKLLSIILALAMMFSVLPASTVLVYADEITETISADTTWNDGDMVGGVTISGGTVTINGDVGITAAITIKGDVTFTGGGTLNRMSTSGNLIKVESGSLTLGNVTIDGNNVIISDSGAAAAINMAGGTVIMNDGAKITNHKRTSGYGPAVYMTSGNFKMKGGTISGCESRNYGGAIYLDGGSFEMNGGIIENNKTTLSSAGYGGGAFYVREATLIINDGLIQNNSSNSGGAIYNTSFGTTIINGGVIKGNTAVGDSPSGSAIFHSCKTTGEATLQIGGNANINVGNDIYLMSNTSATKYVEITSSIKNPLILAIEGESEGRVIADAADGVVLTYNDMAKIRLSNSSYALKLENNQIKLTQTSSGETKFPVYLGYDANNGTNAPNGSSAEIVAGNSATFTISDSVPTRTGYDFLGWATNKDATSAEYSSGGSITISSNTTLYAVWKKISTFETNEFTQPLAITGWTYGETANTPTAVAKYGTIKYTYSNTADGTYTEEVPTNAGTYYVKATVEETADYSGLESNAVEFTILPKTINTAITQLTAPVKNEVPQTEIETDEYTATVVWSPEVTDKFVYNTVYTATITITPKTNYTVKGIAENGYTVSGAQTVTNEADSATVTVVYSATENKNSNEFTQPLAITGWTYGETANTPTAVAKYGTIKYTYSNTADGTYTEEVPTNAGTYYVKATVEETADYSGLESNAVEFTILPKTINTAITQLTAPVKNEVPQTEIETDEYIATVVWSPEVEDKFGYDTIYTATITITPKANYTVKGIAENGYTVSGAQTVTNEADSATVTAVYSATGSYDTVDTNEFTKPLEIVGWTYGDTPNAPTATAKYGTIKYTYSTAADGEYSEIVPTDAGIYYVKAKVEETDKYTGLESDAVEFVIGKKILTNDNITKIADQTYTGEEIKPVIEVKDGDKILVLDTDYTVAYEKNINASEGAKVKVEIISNNYEGTLEKLFTILPKTINSAIILTAPVKNGVPQTEIETDEYTATVAWSPEVTDKFGYSTVYTATITITPKANYTVKGIAENGYTVSGAQTVTNEADSATITAVYAATGSKSSGGSGRTKRYTVSFNTNGGNKITSQTVAKDNSVKEPTAPIKENFEFAGWYTDKELTTKYDFTEKVTKSFTLYAKWTEQKQENGGSEDVINNNSGNENKESSNTIVLTIDEHDALVYGTTKTNDVAPKVVNDRTMLPARFVAENLGATVEWDGEKQLVTITGKTEKQEDVIILITIGSDYAKVNGEDVKLDSPAFVENDRTYTPIRFISENLGATVEWNETEQTVTIQRVK